MKFMTMVVTTNGNAAGAPPPSLMQAIGEMGMEAVKAGVMVENGGMGDEGTMMLTDDEIAFKDGPFAEAKEILGGYAVYDLPTREEAVAFARRFLELHRQHWKGWEGSVQILQLLDMSRPAFEQAYEGGK